MSTKLAPIIEPVHEISNSVVCATSKGLDKPAHTRSLIRAFASGAPQGFWGSGENGYLFSGIWGALVIILGEMGSKRIVLGI